MDMKDINKDIIDKIPQILKELKAGKDIIIKNTPCGVKIQSIKVNTLK